MFSATCVFSLIAQPLTDEPNKKWPYYTPKLAFMLIYIMSIALGVAIGAILAWHLWLIMTGQTTVENHDASHYRGVAKKRGGATVSLCVSIPRLISCCRGIRQLLRPRGSREPQALLQCHI